MHEGWDLGGTGTSIRAVIRSGPFVTLKSTGETVLLRATPEFFPHVGEETWKPKQAVRAWATSMFLPKNTSLLTVRVASQSEHHLRAPISQDGVSEIDVDSSSSEAVRKSSPRVANHDRNLVSYGTIVGIYKLHSGESLRPEHIKSADRILQRPRGKWAGSPAASSFCGAGTAAHAAASVLSRILGMQLSDGEYVLCTENAQALPSNNLCLYQIKEDAGCDNDEAGPIPSSTVNTDKNAISSGAGPSFHEILSGSLQNVYDRRNSSIAGIEMNVAMHTHTSSGGGSDGSGGSGSGGGSGGSGGSDGSGGSGGVVYSSSTSSVADGDVGFLWHSQRDNVPQIPGTFPPKMVTRFLRAADMPLVGEDGNPHVVPAVRGAQSVPNPQRHGRARGRGVSLRHLQSVVAKKR